MAGDVKFAVVPGQLDGGTSVTTDFTKSGFGTPVGAIFILTFDDSDDATPRTYSKPSIGFSDFTEDRCIIHQDADGQAEVDCDAHKSAVFSYGSLTTGGSLQIRGTIGAITDGIRCTNDGSGGSGVDPFCTAILIGGADAVVDTTVVTLNTSVNGTATGSHAGLTDGNDKLVFFIGTNLAAEDSSETGIESSLGVCHIEGSDAGGYTFSQRGMGWSSDHTNVEGSPASILSTDRVLDILTEVGVQDWGAEVTGFSMSGGTITVTTRDVAPAASMEIYAIIVDLDTLKAKVGSVDLPTSGSSWTPSVSLGLTPDFVMLGLTDLTSEDTIATDAEAGVHGLSMVSGTGEESCQTWYNEDAAATTSTNVLYNPKALDLRSDDVATVLQDHSFSSFNAGDWTYTINAENATVAKKAFYLAVGVTTVPPVDTNASWGFGRWNSGIAKTHRRQQFLMPGQPFLHQYTAKGLAAAFPDELLVSQFDPTQLRM